MDKMKDWKVFYNWLMKPTPNCMMQMVNYYFLVITWAMSECAHASKQRPRLVCPTTPPLCTKFNTAKITL